MGGKKLTWFLNQKKREKGFLGGLSLFAYFSWGEKLYISILSL